MCKYYEICPSKVGGCMSDEDKKECIPYIITAYERVLDRYKPGAKYCVRKDDGK